MPLLAPASAAATADRKEDLSTAADASLKSHLACWYPAVESAFRWGLFDRGSVLAGQEPVCDASMILWG